MRFFRFPTAMVRPLSSLVRFSFVISNMPRLLSKNVVHHFPASTLAIASSVLRSRARRRPTTVDFMLFTGDPFRMTGDSYFVFPMVGFGLRTTLLAINREFPVGAVVGRSDESLSRSDTLAKFCGDGAVGRPARACPSQPCPVHFPRTALRRPPPHPESQPKAPSRGRGHGDRH